MTSFLRLRASSTSSVPTPITMVAAAGQGNLTGTATNVTFALPAGIQAGDLIELYQGGADSADGTAPNGGSVTSYAGSGSYTRRINEKNTFAYWPRFCKYYKVADGTEGGTNVTITWTESTSRWSWAYRVWRGVNTTTPYDAAAQVLPPVSSNPNPLPITVSTIGAVVTVDMCVASQAGPSARNGYNIDEAWSEDNGFELTHRFPVTTPGSVDPGAYSWAASAFVVCVTDALRPA